MRKALHAMAHVGLIALQVGNAATKFIPPPWNVAVAGGAALVQGVLAWPGMKDGAAVSPNFQRN